MPALRVQIPQVPKQERYDRDMLWMKTHDAMREEVDVSLDIHNDADRVFSAYREPDERVDPLRDLVMVIRVDHLTPRGGSGDRGSGVGWLPKL